MLARNYICCIIIVAILIPSTFEKVRIAKVGKPRVWNGTRTIPHSRPYIVQISAEDGSYTFCGVLLNAHTILTSADFTTEDAIKIIAGKHLFDAYESTQQTRQLCTTSKHPSSDGFKYDYGLLHLSDPFVLNEYVNAIRMAPPGFEPEGDCTIVGWGSTVPGNVDTFEELNEGVVKFADPAECTFNHPTRICIFPIGLPFREPVICQRDSKIYVYGIHSIASELDDEAILKHGFLASVPELPRDWLMEEVQKAEELCGKSYY